MKRIVLPALALLALAAAAGCSSNKADKPAELVKISNRIDIRRVWHTSLGGEAPKLRLGLEVAVSDGRVFAASYKGEIQAFHLATGRRLWRRALRAPLSGGPAAGFGLVVVGSAKGEVIALSETDGAPRWRVRINAEILAAPAIAADVVVVRGVDGKLHGLSARNGSENWVIDQQVPRLSLRGTSAPVILGDLAICGFDNGRVVAANLLNGTIAWEAAVGQSRGSTELARLIDVDATVVSAGDDLFAVAYQGRVVRLAPDSGQIRWARELSSYRGLAVDADSVYISTAAGDVVKLDQSTGAEQWRQKGLARRQLSAPAIYGGRVVVADIGGVVHWLDPTNGDFVARESGGKRISSTPVVAGDLLLTLSDAGDLNVFRAPAVAAVAAAPADAAAGG